MPSIELIAVVTGGVAVTMGLVVHICLRDTTPEQRPAILRALAELLRSAWPAVGRPAAEESPGGPAGRRGGRRRVRPGRRSGGGRGPRS